MRCYLLAVLCLMEEQIQSNQTPEITPSTSGASARQEPDAAPGSSRRRLLGYGAAAALAAVILAGGVTGLVGARRSSEHPLVVSAARVFGVSAGSVNNRSIRYADYVRDLAALRIFYNANTQAGAPTYTAEQQSDQALSRLIANALIAEVAAEYQVSVGQDEVVEIRKKLAERFENDENKLAEDVKKNFGLELSTFLESVVKPSLLEQKLSAAFASSTAEEGGQFAAEQVKARHILFNVKDQSEDAKVKKTAAKVLARLKKGEDFATLAKEFGSDGTKDQGGDLGWFGRGQMVPEFEQAVFALEPGKLGEELVKTEFGYHIVQVDERRNVRDFGAYMNDRLDKAQIKIYGKIHNPFAKPEEPANETETPPADNNGNGPVGQPAE